MRQGVGYLLRWGLWLALLLCGLTHAAVAAITVTVGTDPSKSVLKGRLVTPAEVLDGELVIEGDTITCVAVVCQEPPGATIFVLSNAYIFPGFIDAHNHVAYNVLPKWTPPKQYQNRGQWQRAAAYKAFKQPYTQLKDHDKLFCEMVKYGELKALLSGVTTIQGTSPNQACFRTLIRNAENQNELGTPPSYIRTFILDIKSFPGPPPDWTVTKAFVVHLAEGVRGDAPLLRSAFAGDEALFFRGNSSLCSSRHTVGSLTSTLPARLSPAWSSPSVASGRVSTAARNSARAAASSLACAPPPCFGSRLSPARCSRSIFLTTAVPTPNCSAPSSTVPSPDSEALMPTQRKSQEYAFML